MRLRSWWLAGFAVIAPIVRARAQDPARVEALAPLLMAEDRRDYDPSLLLRSAGNPDSLVRRTTALVLGRLRDTRGTSLLVAMLRDSDQVVVANAFFSLGLLRDTAAVQPIVDRLRTPDSLGSDAIGEAATALARIGGPAAAQAVAAMLAGNTDVTLARQQAFVPNALLDAWKLGPLMPSQAMVHFTSDTSVDLRWRALYSLGRMRVPASGHAMLNAARDQSPLIREAAVKSLTRRFADSAGLATPAVRAALNRALTDDQAGVRTSAVMALATFADSSDTRNIADLLSDGDPNVRVAATSALGMLVGSAAAQALNGVFDRHDATWAMRNAALPALARSDSALFARRAATALASTDFRDRIAALDAWPLARLHDPAVFRGALTDPDPRVQAAALTAWSHVRGDTAVAAAARTALRSSSPDVRTAAVSALRSSATLDDLDPLIATWRRALGDPESDERLAVLATLHAISRRQPGVLELLADPARQVFLERPADPVVRAEAARSWPELAARWGDPWPIETGHSLDDYRTIVRTIMLADSDTHVTIDVQGKGPIDLQLLGHEAPLTVSNFLRLVDRHYFDNVRWHRVVPDFVVQDGDPTGTGDGGPGWSIRDEFNRERYLIPMAGMALSGPDTGGSQWFINLSPQPHLDGQYTIFGKVDGSYVALDRVVQGDLIRSIHR